ncbi:uncharacterized protein Tco025E_07602 [Trypanosoma conorhini]|uniref:Uncharacterized protein n=1 Tax=Trypanosoma conorhini TaxID=83891 RepID=A0A3R7L2L1_9TRYP|nr:uncharacterized protein Tco025E_07602 [Trypanosoma conorhini]RNF06326.1 hypothetical protein Tco025E_07602 [Trypanosoma conorhini]
MEDKLRTATREELVAHVRTQRLLIRHLHRRIVELERAVSSAPCNWDPGRGGAAASAPSSPQRGPPAATLSEGLREIGRLLQAHATGAAPLPQELVAEFLYIQSELAAAEPGETPALSAGRLAVPAPAAGGACVYATPPGEGSGAPRRFSPPSSLIQRTQQRLSATRNDGVP